MRGSDCSLLPCQSALNGPKESTILHVLKLTQTERSGSFFFFISAAHTFTAALIPHLLSLQYKCGAASSAVVLSGDGKQLEVGGDVGSTVKDLSKIKDVGEIEMLVSGLFFFHQFLMGHFTKITQKVHRFVIWFYLPRF